MDIINELKYINANNKNIDINIKNLNIEKDLLSKKIHILNVMMIRFP